MSALASTTPSAQARPGPKAGRAPQNKRRGAPHGKRGRHGNPEQKYLAAMAMAQLEWFFTVENLCQDTFLRSNLDEEGYVPVALVCNFPPVAGFGASYADILECLKESQVVELDEKNETVRCRDKPQQWVFPTPAPRWIKQEPVRQPRSPRTDAAGNEIAGGDKTAMNRSLGAADGASPGRGNRQNRTHNDNRSPRNGENSPRRPAPAPKPKVFAPPPSFGENDFPPLSATTVC